MAKVLSAISRDAPASPLSATVNDTFSFAGTPTLTGSGGVQRYDFRWVADSGSGYAVIGASGGLTTADTNPVINTNSQNQNSITVTCSQAGTHTIRMEGAPTSGGSYTIFSSTATITVAAGPVSITPANTAHSLSSTSPTIAAHSTIAAADAAHAHSATSPAVTIGGSVSPDNATHGHSSTSPTIAANATIAANDNSIGLVSTSPAVAFVPLIAVNGATHTHYASTIGGSVARCRAAKNWAVIRSYRVFRAIRRRRCH